MEAVRVVSGVVQVMVGANDGGYTLGGGTRPIAGTTTPPTTIAAAKACYGDSPYRTFQAVARLNGQAVSATVNIYGTNDPPPPAGATYQQAWATTPVGTIALSGTDNGAGVSDGFCTANTFKWVCAVVTGLTAGATISVTLGG